MKRRFLVLIAGILLIFSTAAVSSFNVWAPWIGGYLIVNQTPQRSDVIIILSGTDDGGRIRYGVTLYKRGFAPKILLSGSSYLLEETGIDLMKVYALSLGVPERDIWVDRDSGSTVENARFAKGITDKNRCQSVLVVTSPAHSRRTKMVFNKMFPKEISVTVSCDPSTFDVKRWWKTPAIAREVGYEYFVFLCYMFFGF
ncbi:MAG TPA: YdcF family protein [Thermodesulfobacteriota bacterium]|nr:YdcF family protein [Thermodesulfobacteriota bacterium]